MRIEFTATQAGSKAEAEALVVRVATANGGEYLTFQRSPQQSGEDEDWGIHIEYADESNGDYEVIAACRVSRAALQVDLSKQLGNLKDVAGFNVVLDIPAELYAALVAGLRGIFRGKEQILEISV